jgi:hypothetical protein
MSWKWWHYQLSNWLAKPAVLGDVELAHLYRNDFFANSQKRPLGSVLPSIVKEVIFRGGFKTDARN